ncbi:asparagine synthase (glutamine-hydrolyzing) [Cytophagaceae bacterium DM2B3-1]|uniref:asparagine synthase (glutamine-hydrolyzing) n=1 Tax=Xanthocytophaga flava TaxID=3048013 RepID=A0ABT7CD02_9BACT|nr:asparagine synthase (glutamine-hydrolyzing) [Xanthocytophaga flavus]MDJ1491582.1 asparagine synthase (glutamine-hydrolyzing) [Xanthocytophaga flavus]
MCGIHIIVDKQNQLDEKPIQLMLSATHYRGPDAQDWTQIVSSYQTIWMANNRLKISDLRDIANQPMKTGNGQYTLVFNGAIYNHIALRTTHLKETEFVTQSDTETLLQLVARHGHSIFSELNGMFAIAFYDKLTEKLSIARDRWGIKPLYWFENNAFLIISSEIKGILATGLVPKRPNLNQIQHYLSFKFPRRPQTFYENIFEVEPGKICQASYRDDLHTIRQLHVPQRSTVKIPNKEDIQNNIAQALEETVYQYTTADVPSGLFLSGGIDSTLLLASLHTKGVKDFPVFTIGYTDSDKPYATKDQHFAQQAARQYRAAMHEVVVDSQLFVQFSEWVKTIDQPVADGAAWLTYLLSQEARKYVKIILSGAGADELFAGYNRHWAYYQYLRTPSFIRKSIPLLHHIPQYKFAKTHYGRLWEKALQQLHSSPEQTYVRFTSGATSFPWHKELSSRIQAELFTNTGKKESVENYLTSALHFDQSHYLISDVLTITDRMTMQHGIEARVPYLDNTVVEQAQNISAIDLLKYGKKWLLKDILSQKQGTAYNKRRKEGFGMPLGHWLRKPVSDNIFRSLQNSDSLIYEIVDYAWVQQLKKNHITGSADYTSELWGLSLLATWLELNF